MMSTPQATTANAVRENEHRWFVVENFNWNADSRDLMVAADEPNAFGKAKARQKEFIDDYLAAASKLEESWEKDHLKRAAERVEIWEEIHWTEGDWNVEKSRRVA